MKWSMAKVGTGIAIILALSMPLIAKQPAETGTIRGRVTDLFGSSVSGADIEVLAETSQKRFQTKTDGNGNYELSNVPAGQLTIRINSVGFLREERSIRLANDETVLVDFGLEAGRLTDLPVIKVSGTVYGPKDVPLRDAAIEIRSAFKNSIVFVGRTDAQGRYLLEVHTPGQYIVSASKPGYVISTKAVLLMPSLPRKDVTANFVLTPFTLN